MPTTSPPSVCCICLTADRQAFTDRAVRCFRRQTYPNRWLLIWDTGRVPYVLPQHAPGCILVRPDPPNPRTIGELRNEANSIITSADIIAHWDSDDVSLKYRLEEQVECLESTRAFAIGYSSMPFWDGAHAWEFVSQYTSKPLGTSLIYPRSSWQGKPFPAANSGEDSAWLRGENSHALPAGFRMIATLHGGNTSSRVTNHQEWQRAEHLDDWCREMVEKA